MYTKFLPLKRFGTLEYKVKIIGNGDYSLFLYIYKVPRAKRLIKFEKRRIVELSLPGFSCWAIAKSIRRHKTVVHIFLQLSDNYGKKKILEEDLKCYHPEKREEFCNLHRPENIQVRKLLSKPISTFAKTLFATLLEGLAIFNMQ